MKKQPPRLSVGVDLAVSPDEIAMVIAEVGESQGASPETITVLHDFIKAGAPAITDCMETLNQAMQGMNAHLETAVDAFTGFQDAVMSDDVVMAAVMAHLAARPEPEPEPLSWEGWPLGGPDGEA